MCGIVGVVDNKKQTKSTDISMMANSLTHRGPDDDGEWQDKNGKVFFGFRRLAFFDISSTGHQPMYFDGLSIVFNGEIYNHQDIRDELIELGHTFVGTSDTETILHSWREWGNEAIHKFRGMFAFAIYDERVKQLCVYRDRFGIKPLYYYERDGLFAFASEIKALLKHPVIGQDRTIDREALSLFLQLAYIPAPYSIFSHIKKLQPGHFLTISDNGSINNTCYWRLADYYQKQDYPELEKETVLDEIEGRFMQACSLRMLSDRPVGMFLSGGIDSSLVVAVLKKSGYENINTFTIGFDEAGYDESMHAKEVARHFGTRHNEKRCTTKEALDIVPKLPEIFDEPMADASAIPTYMLSEFTRQEVVASLSADGGDELFGGYNSYKSALKIYRWFRYVPSVAALFFPVMYLIIKLGIDTRILPPITLHKFNKAVSMYPVRNDVARLFARLQSHMTDAEVYDLLGDEGKSAEDIFNSIAKEVPDLSPRRTLQHIDIRSYMVDDILVKVDRSSMAHSLEGREPMLDHKVAEYVVGLPDSVLYENDSINKSLLRSLLYKYIPKEVVNRPKQGFGVPLNEWLKEDLSYLIDEYLSNERITREGNFSPSAVSRVVSDFRSGNTSYAKIWNLITFQMWYEKWVDQTSEIND